MDLPILDPNVFYFTLGQTTNLDVVLPDFSDPITCLGWTYSLTDQSGNELNDILFGFQNLG